MRRNGAAMKGVLAVLGVTTVVTLLSVWILPGKAMPQAAPPQSLPVFCAPSHVPAGENWVFIGSLADLPQDIQVTTAAMGVVVLEEQWISPKALCVRLQAVEGIGENLLRVTSAEGGTEAVPDLHVGAPLQLISDTSFTEEDFVDGRLILGGDTFLYGYLPRESTAIAAVRIHNRATGEWSCHEIAGEKAVRAEETALEITDPSFVETDVHETLPDTDGDGIYDFEEELEPVPPAPGQLGVGLAPGGNVLDIIAIDEHGTASWRTIDLYTTFKREE